MTVLLKRLINILLAVLFTPFLAFAQTPETVSTTALIGQYTENVIKACPVFWEAVGARVDPDQRSTNLWVDDDSGRSEFMAFLGTQMGSSAPDASGLAAMAGDPLTVATECAAQKIQLMQSMVVDLPVNILESIRTISQNLGASVDTAGQPSGNINIGKSFSDGFLVGDIRMTGRRAQHRAGYFCRGKQSGRMKEVQI